MSLSRGATTVMFNAPFAHGVGMQEPTFTGSLYFMVDDADALWSELQHTTKVCYPIETFDYGMREFAVYDNNGYLVQFGKDLQA